MSAHLLLRTNMHAIALALSLLAAATTAVAQTRCVTAQNHFLLNGAIIPSEGKNDLLNVLRSYVSPLRLALSATSPDDQPVVVLDGVILHGGVLRLSEIPPRHVASVAVLRPNDATPYYGNRARNGAILVKTIRGPGLICGKAPTVPR